MPTGWAAFRALDDADDVEAALRWLRAVAALLPVREGKRRSYELLALEPGQSVLDVGCGDGSDLGALAALGARAVGVDSSARAVAAARAAVPSAQVEVADAVALPFEPDTFDACRCDRTLQHVGDPAGALAEMVRVTRPGGAVVVCEGRHRVEGDLALPGLEPEDRERSLHYGLMLPVLIQQAGVTDVEVEHVAGRLERVHEIATFCGLPPDLVGPGVAVEVETYLFKGRVPSMSFGQ